LNSLNSGLNNRNRIFEQLGFFLFSFWLIEEWKLEAPECFHFQKPEIPEILL